MLLVALATGEKNSLQEIWHHLDTYTRFPVGTAWVGVLVADPVDVAGFGLV